MLEWLLDYSVFMTRDRCGEWGLFMVYLYQFCNCGIALAYVSIPLSLCWLSSRLPIDGKHRGVITLFITFLLACAVHHICQVFAFYKPAYRLFTLIDAILASITLATAFYLPFVVISVTRHTPRGPRPKEPSTVVYPPPRGKTP